MQQLYSLLLISMGITVFKSESAMKVSYILILSLLVLSLARISCADSLVITYSNGKTQTVPLDEVSSAIQSFRYVPEKIPSATNNPVLPENIAVSEQPKVTPPENHQNQSKRGVKFKWAEPVIGQ